MTELEITSRVELPAEPDTLWRLAMDWPRQGDWMLATQVSGGSARGSGWWCRSSAAACR